MSAETPEVAAILSQAMDAYTHGRLDESRNLIADALAREPQAGSVTELAGRLFPELLAAKSETFDGGWQGSDVLDVDWGEAAAGLETSSEVYDPGPPDPAGPATVEPPPAEPPPAEPAPAVPFGGAPQVPDDPWAVPPAEPPPAEPPPAELPPAEPSWADALNTPWADAVAPAPADAPETHPAPVDPTREAEAPGDPWGDAPGATPNPPPAYEPASSPGLDLLSPPPPPAAAEPSPGPTTSPEPEAAAPAPVEPDPKAEEVANLMQGARELHELGDFSGSLELVEKALEVDPESPDAKDYLSRNEATLVHMYESKFGSPEAVPQVAIPPDEVVWLNLDHRAGFLLAQIDGMISFEDLYALSGMSRLDTSRILAQLVEEGVILPG